MRKLYVTAFRGAFVTISNSSAAATSGSIIICGVQPKLLQRDPIHWACEWNVNHIQIFG